MKPGPERNKVIVLVLLMAVAAVLLYNQFSGGSSAPAAAGSGAPTRTPAPARSLRASADDVLGERSATKSRTPVRANSEFRPAFPKKVKDQALNPDKIDPTLRTDLLAKVQAVNYEGVERNLFLFGAAKPKPTPQQIEAAKEQAKRAQEKIAESKPSAPADPPKPTAPPVSFKYYGYANRPGDARKHAFLLDGEDILVASEGEVIKKRYKVVRIGINSMVVEDLDFHSQQTVPLQETS